MNYGFIMTRTMYPLEEKKKILKKYFFDNPRTSDEIREVAKILKQTNCIDDNPLPEDEMLYGESFVSLEKTVDKFFEKYELDRKYLRKENGEECEDIYYKLAKNWIIIRFDDFQRNPYVNHKMYEEHENENLLINNMQTFDKNYEDAIKYFNLLTFICFPDNWYKQNSYIMTEFFDLYDIEGIRKNAKNMIMDIVILSNLKKENDEENNFRYCSFDFFYNKVKQYEELLTSNIESPIVEYIANNINMYISLTDDKMRIITLVSLIELLLTHNPDSNRFNIEDSIRKQFANKLTLLLYLNDKNINNEQTEKILLLIYDIRSAIAHGSFDKIDDIAKKVDKWLVLNYEDYDKLKKSDGFKDGEYDIEWVLENINEMLEKYFRIVLIEFLKDKKLFEILKK